MNTKNKNKGEINKNKKISKWLFRKVKPEAPLSNLKERNKVNITS